MFDVSNLESYDLILGTPFLYQHRILLGLNPTQVIVNSIESLPIRGMQTVRLEVNAAGSDMSNIIEQMRAELYEYATPICKEALETPLPPLRSKGLDHEINLIDPNLKYVRRHTRCPEGLRPAWNQKRSDYVKCKRWVVRSGMNAVPMFIMQKPTKDGLICIRAVCDTRERNRNTIKLYAPLPDTERIIRSIVVHLCWSLLDGKDVYEQIRILVEHIDR